VDAILLNVLIYNNTVLVTHFNVYGNLRTLIKYSYNSSDPQHMSLNIV